MSAIRKCVLRDMSTGHKCIAGCKRVGDTTEYPTSAIAPDINPDAISYLSVQSSVD